MPRASHRLDLVLVPDDPDRAVDGPALQALVAAWRRRGDLVAGGVGAVRADLPAGVALYANQLGGFRVTCPETGANLVPAFNRAITAWRAGGPRSLACPACGADHALEALAFAPPAAFARGGVVLADVGSLDLAPVARAEAEAVLGPLRLVAKRVG